MASTSDWEAAWQLWEEEEGEIVSFYVVLEVV